MKQFLFTALALVTFGLFGTESANAAWQDEVFGNATNRQRSEDRSTASKPTREGRSARATRTTPAAGEQTERRAARPQRVARETSSSNSGGTSIGGGLASYYWQPQRVASGGWFNPNALTAAHKTLPFGTRVRVTNERNGQSVDVTINDRGPYIAGRVIDLSSAAAGAINMKGAGVVPVRIAVLGR